jgi:hypothetical protein
MMSVQKTLTDQIVAPFNVRRTDNRNCAAFSNEVEKFGVRSSAISSLPNGGKGFKLKLAASDSGHEYEVEVTAGHARLGLVQAPRTTKSCLAEGSASSESTWTRFAAVIRQKEGK